MNEQSDNERKRGHKQTFAQSLYPVVKVGLMKQTSSAVNCYRVQNQELLTDKSPQTTEYQELLTNKCPQDEPLRTEYGPYAAYGYPDLVNPYAHHAMSR